MPMASTDPKKILNSIKEIIIENEKMKKEISELKREVMLLRQRDTLLARSVLRLYKGNASPKKGKKR